MKNSLISSIFKRSKTLLAPDSLPIKALKQVAKEQNFLLFKDISLYFKDNQFFIPLIILDPIRGLYIFQKEESSYMELQKKDVQEVESKIVVLFSQLQQHIKEKLYKNLAYENFPIHHFLLMENFNIEQYQHSSEAFQKLFSQENIIFSNSTTTEILEKLNNALEKTTLPNQIDIVANLIPYCVIYDGNTASFATEQQLMFITAAITKNQTLQAPPKSGKTASLILKALYHKLQNPNDRVILLQQTPFEVSLAKQFMQKHNIKVDILTPNELLRSHLLFTKQTTLSTKLSVEKSLMKKRFDIAEVILCDDAQHYQKDFLEYLQHIQAKGKLVLVNSDYNTQESFNFEENFYAKELEIKLIQTQTPKEELFKLLEELLKEYAASEIVVFTSSSKRKEFYIELKKRVQICATLFNTKLTLDEQDIQNLLFMSYEDTLNLNNKVSLFIADEANEYEQLQKALSVATTKNYLFFKEETLNILKIKNRKRG